ncbi:hypothetical protein LTR36_007826 [Oleoguttula mirabilis]|uniref:Rab-GAP TBC domain-containing protein n=1 Tax=Oleoguttula mirabilis TaxID=1507867 RepID=A0AAV9J9T7_9PEZI|nr:hypothetical protein LTR36_007826 [Oleoguttula mirabilis]
MGRQDFLPPLTASWRLEPLSPAEKDKVHRILRACRDRDLDELRGLGTTEGGLIEDEVRRTAWPILLGSDQDQHATNTEWSSLPGHRDEHQVELDVNRSFVYYPEDETEERRNDRKHELSGVIIGTLRQHPILHYFQGYHDIVQVLLLVLGANTAALAVPRLSLLRIRDFMLPTMSGTEPHLDLIKAILYTVDPVLASQLSRTQPFFALSATLTLYAHDIEAYGDIARLYDFLLASEAAMSLYLFAVIVMSRKEELLELEADEPEMLLVVLSKLPKPLDLESLIRYTSEIFTRYPPESLSQPPMGSWSLSSRAWSRVSGDSVLKTTHGDPHKLAKQSLTDGELMFDRHAAEIKRAEVWKRQVLQTRRLAKRCQWPATYTAAAVIIAVMALLLRRSIFQPTITA